MPGSGIRADTAKDLLGPLVKYGLQEVHMSGGTWVPGKMVYRREGLGMGVGGPSEWGIFRTNEDEIEGVKDLIDSWNAQKRNLVEDSVDPVSHESPDDESPGA